MKKFSNKILVIALVALVVLFAATRLFRSPARESNLDANALAIDTSNISKIEIHPSTDGKVILRRDGQAWKAAHDSIHVDARTSNVRALLRSLAGLEPERIVSRNRDKWVEFGLGDTSAVKVVVFRTADSDAETVWFGEEAAGHTYVRKNGGAEVYAVSGSPAVDADRPFAEWRDPSLLRLQRDLITKITFDYPADTGFVVEKKNTWTIDDVPADSAAVENYLNQMRSKDHTAFADGFSPAREPDVTVTFSGGDETVVKAWNTALYEWVYSSSRQPGVYFIDGTMALTRSMLAGKKKFVKK